MIKPGNISYFITLIPPNIIPNRYLFHDPKKGGLDHKMPCWDKKL
jgi:hypothetical protein